MLTRMNSRVSKVIALSAKRGTVRFFGAAVKENEESSTVEYPAILDLSFRAKKARKEQEWHEKIKHLKTVEEKLFELNMPRYYGWKSVILEEHVVRYNTLDLAQHITRTHVTHNATLPESYDSTGRKKEQSVDEDIIREISPLIQKTLTFENCNHRHRLGHSRYEGTSGNEEGRENRAFVESVINQINRILLTSLCPKYPHLLEAETERNPRVEAFWFAGGMEPTTCVRKSKEGREWSKEYANDPVDRSIQYFGAPVLHLRHALPLGETAPPTESQNPALNVPEFRLDPRTMGYCMKRMPATNIPGFWPGDTCEFGLLSYHNMGDYLKWPKGRDDIDECITVQALLASYAWLFTQACYQGFSTFTDLTYPLTTQTIITDGQWWSFCIYQLNTTLIHGEQVNKNPKRNLCWVTKPMKLYETVDVESGKIHGFNEDVLRNLLNFYTNVPQKRVNTEMKPYLGEDVKVIADIPEEERRVWLENNYKHLVSGRPRHRRIPEIYHWQKIYMIDNKTRPFERRRDFWQFGIDPFKRRLDDHTPKYIPRRLREFPNKRKYGRWEKTYYP